VSEVFIIAVLDGIAHRHDKKKPELLPSACPVAIIAA